jgi:PAS domain S-box-containing protein
MYGITAKTRIAVGQAFLLLSVLLVALAIGLVPDPRIALMAGRLTLCDALAAHSSAAVGQNDVRRLDSILRFIVARNPEILTAAVRRQDGQLMVEVGEHAGQWNELPDERSTDGQIQVPIRAGSQKWGTVEVRFTPLTKPGLFGYLQSPRARLVAFVVASSLVLFMVYLGKMLQHLDPSKVVPKRVRDTLNTLAEGLLVVDRNGRIVLANDVFAGIVGSSPDKLIGRRAAQLAWVQNDDQTEDELPWVRALAEESMLANVPIQLRDALGELRSFMANCMPVQGSDGKCRGVFATFEDVTELERNKVEISKAKEAAEAANVAKSEFLARMSHEIRTPMNAILGFTEVLRRGFDGSESERQDYLETIHGSGQHLLNLINDILDLSKVEAGKLDVERVRCSPIQVVAEVVTMLSVRAKQKGITLESELESGLPETILSDPTRLRQILMNLVGNAIKFTETGSVKIALRLKSDSVESRLVIDVIDSGIGIAPEAVSKIFDPFTQADTSITRRFGGTGLGLAICRRFADLLGGELSVESVLGVGSTFRLTLPTGPLDGVRILDVKSAVQSLRERTSGSRGAVKLPSARILVVDDGAENRKLVELVLRRAGVQVQSATNGAQAVELTTGPDATRFDIVLMDVQMPVMDGYTAVRTMRQRGVTVPVFALTAHAMKGTEEQCRQAGYSGYLPKPLDLDGLLHMLAQHLGSPAGADTSGSSRTDETSREIAMNDIVQNCGAAPRGATTPAIGTGSTHDPGQSPTAVAPALNAEPLVSSLPCDDPEFRDIVADFVERLRDRMREMESVWSQGDVAQLQRLAHWLKGSGGTAGFDAFTRPARELELSLKEGRTDESAAKLAELRELVNRIVVEPAEAVPCDASR